jgi:putative transposase
VNRKRYPTDLEDSEWAVIAGLMPATARTGRPRKHEYREIVNAIFYVLANGIKWRAMPHDMPPWQTVYHYFRRWRLSGYWKLWNRRLRERLRLCLGRKAQASAAILDSQSIKSAEGGQARGYDAHKRCSGRKRHILVDTLGLLLAALVTSANVQDRDAAKVLLAGFYRDFFQSFWLKRIWADAGYQGALILWVQVACDWLLDIVRRNPRTVGFEVLPKRWIVERTFAWFVRNRRLARDFERLPQTSEAFLYIAMIRLMSRRLAKF